MSNGDAFVGVVLLAGAVVATTLLWLRSRIDHSRQHHQDNASHVRVVETPYDWDREGI